MKMYLKNFSYDELDDIYDDVKVAVCDRASKMLADLQQVLEFAAEENNLGKFDDLLDTHSVNEINL